VTPGRLGVYLDDVYHVAGPPGDRRVSSDRSFLMFVTELGSRFDDLVLFGRAVHGEDASDYVLPAGTKLVELPHYSALNDVREVLPTVSGTLRALWHGLPGVDVVWVFGPHPFALAFALMALARRKRVVLGVRQNSVELYEARLSSRWSPPMLAVRFLDAAYRLLSRRLRTTVQGAVLARRFGGDRPGLLTMSESIVRTADVVREPIERDWTAPVELLTVGRLEPEKNPFLLVDAFGRLQRERPGRYRLTWVGRGPLEADVRRRAEEQGLAGSIEFLSYVPFGDPLLSLYRRAHMFVHVSLSEGMPKVLIEALASSTPIVATDVGGVRGALDGGRAGLLVPPDDLDALVAAVEELAADEHRRDEVVGRGLELVERLTLEAQADAVERFVRN
jgi:glycosyltransferase involved in cell wall biosynthesis